MFASEKDILINEENIFKTSDYGEWMPVKVIGYILLLITLVLVVSYIIPIKKMLLEVFHKSNSKSCVWNFLFAFSLCVVLFGFTVLMNSLSFTITLMTSSLYPVVRLAHSGLLHLPSPLLLKSNAWETRSLHEVCGCGDVGVLSGLHREWTPLSLSMIIRINS